MIDAHVHVACAGDRFPREAPGVGSDWSQHGGTAGDLVTALDRGGVDRAVVVQAIGVHGYDCACAAEAVAAGDGRFALVGAVDMAGPDPAADLAALAAATPLAGVRAFGVGRAGPGWLTDGKGSAVWDAADELGIVVVPTIFTEALPGLRAIVERHPDVNVALDHCAFPDMATPPTTDALTALADLPQLHVKVTSHNLDGPSDPAAFLEPLAEAFGAGRICWGSDHPQHQSLDYDEMVALARRAARNLGNDDQANVLGGTSARLWWPSASSA